MTSKLIEKSLRNGIIMAIDQREDVMIQRLSEHFNVTETTLSKLGVFNSFIGIDTKVFLDPLLLERLDIPEFSKSRQKIKDHYRKIIKLLKASKKEADLPWIEAFKLMKVKEIRGFSVGYGNQSDDGSGIGPKLAKQLTDRAKEIIDLGIEDPEFFELIGLFEKDIGADRLSDLTIKIVIEDILEFSQRVTSELSIKDTVNIKYQGANYTLPRNPNERKPIFLLPEAALRELPIAQDWDQIDYASHLNRDLRQKVNESISRVWKETISEQKASLSRAISHNPEILQGIIEAYKESDGKPYDFVNDPRMMVLWRKIGLKYANSFPLEIPVPKEYTKEKVYQILDTIIKQFIKLVEHNGLNKELYDENGKPKHEEVSQRIFFAIADTYCEANNLVISREPNAGSGPVDFKFGNGYKDQILVEVKLSKNTGLQKKYKTQLDAYMKAENTEESIYLVIKVAKESKALEELVETYEEAKSKSEKVPELYVVDAVIKPSASKR